MKLDLMWYAKILLYDLLRIGYLEMYLTSSVTGFCLLKVERGLKKAVNIEKIVIGRLEHNCGSNVCFDLS
jgi:hypothetical protein